MDTEEFQDTAIDFYEGCNILGMVAAWAFVMANQQMVLEKLNAFEKAYGRISELVAAGKAGIGEADMSEENIERARRILHLLQPGLDSVEARRAAQEIYTLAQQCLQGLTRKDDSPAGGDAS